MEGRNLSVYNSPEDFEESANDLQHYESGIYSFFILTLMHVFSRAVMTHMSQIECEQVAARLYLKVFR